MICHEGVGLSHKKEAKPIVHSHACGVVQCYKTKKVRRCMSEIKRVIIRFDGTGIIIIC